MTITNELRAKLQKKSCQEGDLIVHGGVCSTFFQLTWFDPLLDDRIYKSNQFDHQYDLINLIWSNSSNKHCLINWVLSTGSDNINLTNMIKQAQLGVPHSEIQVELDWQLNCVSDFFIRVKEFGEFTTFLVKLDWQMTW